MSMIGEYFRVSPAELERAVREPDRMREWIEEMQDSELDAGASPAGARHYSTYKTWDLLRFLLRRAGFPVDVVHGEEPLGAAGDWGYGPPLHLTAERVGLAAGALGRLTYDQLLEGVEPAELLAADVYPLGWEDEASLEWGREYYCGLTEYLTAAAAEGQAVIVWLD
ncbi:YfbM family protein [Streptomyces xanthophaeus]